MENEKKFDDKCPDDVENSVSGLRVPLPAMLIGLGILASAAQAEAAPAPQVNNNNYLMHQNSVLSGVNLTHDKYCGNCTSIISSVPTLEPAALVGLSGLLAFYGLRRRKRD